MVLPEFVKSTTWSKISVDEMQRTLTPGDGRFRGVPAFDRMDLAYLEPENTRT